MTRPSRRAALAYADLERARAALARAVEASADPWRVTELRLRLERATDRAVAADGAGSVDDDYDADAPAPRGPVGPWPVRR